MALVVHIHFGPGRLGLGLLVWSGRAAGFDVHVVAYPHSPVDEDTALEVVVRSQDGTDAVPVTLDVASTCRAAAFGELGPPVRHALGAAEHVLITTAVTTDGIPAIADLLLAVAEQRPRRPGATTTFIAGENDPGESFAGLVANLRARGVDCRRTMVNRICFEPVELRRHGARVVRADCLVEWLIEGRPDGPALAALDELEHVRFVEDIEPYELRKRWLVIGGHLALAIMARLHNYECLDVEAGQPGRSDWLERLHAVLIQALEKRFAQLEDNAAYAAKHVEAWVRHDDPTRRILRRLKRLNLVAFLEDLDRKLGEALASADVVRDERWSVIEELFEVLHRVLRNVQQYEDLEEAMWYPQRLRAADEDAVLYYKLMLVRLVGGEVAGRRAAELGEAFAAHRDVLGQA